MGRKLKILETKVTASTTKTRAKKIAISKNESIKYTMKQYEKLTETKKKPTAKLIAVPRCSKGHILKRIKASHPRIMCDLCSQMQTRGSWIRSCSKCDFDMCMKCRHASKASARLVVGVAKAAGIVKKSKEEGLSRGKVS